MLDSPPTNDRLHVEVVSTSSRSLRHTKVHVIYDTIYNIHIDNVK